ncbi:MAG TPA: zinc-binding dehydrogenase [Bacillales bacterium]|nr:zinc-binding dehydrogenase [Bacillales bacterium]
MKAVVHVGNPGMDNVFIRDIDEPELGFGQVKVRLKSAGMNHRDLFVPNRRSSEDPPVTLGSDGAGIVEAVGEGVDGIEVGQEVVINPSLGWHENSSAPPEGFEILGNPDDGTFAEAIVVPAANIEAKPEYLTWEEAGVLPLGALTAYRALFTRGKADAGMTVFIPGVGSGVATFLVQMAKAVGARVVVTSRSEEKRKRALELGADAAVDSNGDWKEALADERIDLVIESVGAATWNQSLEALRPGGTMVVFGASAGDEVTLNLRSFFYGQYNLLGSTMGSSEEFRDMLQFIEQHKIRPVVDEYFPLDQAKQAFRKLSEGKQFGKIGLTIG